MIDFQVSGWWWVWMLPTIAAIVGVLVLSRYERRLVAPRLGYALLALRITAVCVLALALFKPVVTLSREDQTAAQIVVALDVSQSMQTADSQMSPAQKLRWARALQTIGNDANREQLDQWQQALDDQTDLQAHREMLLPILEDIGRLTRLEIAERLLSSTQTPLLRELRQIGDVRFVLFADQPVDAVEETLVSEKLGSIDGLNSNVTDIQSALAESIRSRNARPVSAVVLLSDGRETAENDPQQLAQILSEAQIPVYPVQLGTSDRPSDISIADVDHPPSVFLGDTTRITATVGTHGYEGREFEVTLTPESGEPISKTVTAAEPETTVHFQWRADRAGRHPMTVSVSAQSGEIRDDNNSAAFALNVVDDTVRVLLLDQEARWEFRFIDNAYRRDERVDAQRVVFVQPHMDVLNETFFPSEFDWPADPADWGTSPLAEFDLVIVGDVSQEFLTPTAWETLERFVEEGRGSLVLSTGRNYVDRDNPPEARQRLSPVVDLQELSVTSRPASNSSREFGFHLQLTPLGESAPMLFFGADMQQNREIWDSFPGHAWGMTGKAKPGADVLAKPVAAAHQNDKIDPDRAVIARHNYGSGQVLWLGIDSTWRWRYRTGDRFHHRFWGQVARWAALNRSLQGNSAVRFGVERSDIEQGTEAVVVAQFSSVFLERFPNLKATAQISSEGTSVTDETTAQVSLAPSNARPTVFEGRINDLPVGTYKIVLVLDDAEWEDEELTAELSVLPQTTRELADLTADSEYLRQIAEGSGGRLVAPQELQQLPSWIEQSIGTTAKPESIPLWNHPWLLVVFCVLVGAEWTIRKLNGLP